jgi:hypothetical protein
VQDVAQGRTARRGDDADGDGQRRAAAVCGLGREQSLGREPLAQRLECARSAEPASSSCSTINW